MLSTNLLYLRNLIGHGKDQFGKLFGLTRGVYANYEKDVEPKLSLLLEIANFYKKGNNDLTIDDLLNKDLSQFNFELNLAEMQIDFQDNIQKSKFSQNIPEAISLLEQSLESSKNESDDEIKNTEKITSKQKDFIAELDSDLIDILQIRMKLLKKKITLNKLTSE